VEIDAQYAGQWKAPPIVAEYTRFEGDSAPQMPPIVSFLFSSSSILKCEKILQEMSPVHDDVLHARKAVSRKIEIFYVICKIRKKSLLKELFMR
jgi:hypothetical protein